MTDGQDSVLELVGNTHRHNWTGSVVCAAATGNKDADKLIGENL
jgi:hypothetical protein